MKFNWNDKTILIAEDEPANFLFIEKIVSPTQVNILRADNGEEAIKLVKEHPEIDLVLMDIYMPGIDGFETTEQIKIIKPFLPVVAQTFYESKIDKEKVESACFDDFIRKPININKLLAIMAKYLKSTNQVVNTNE